MTAYIKFDGEPVYGEGVIAAIIGPRGKSASRQLSETIDPDTDEPYIPEDSVPAFVDFIGEQAEVYGTAAGTAAAQAETAALNARITEVETGKEDQQFVFPMAFGLSVDSGGSVLLAADSSRLSITIELLSRGAAAVLNLIGGSPSLADRNCVTLTPANPIVSFSGAETPKSAITAASMGGPVRIKITVTNNSGLDPRMADFLAKFPVAPTGDVLTAIQNFYSEIGALGLLDRGQSMFVLAAENEGAAGVDWIGDGAITKHGTITHGGMAGYTGNGTTGYLSTGVLLPFGRYKTSDAAMFCDIGSYTATSNSQWTMGFGGGGILANRDTVSGGRWQLRSNISSGGDVVALGLGGFGGWSRNSDSEYRAFRETTVTPVTQSSVTSNQREWLLCALNGAGGITGYSAAPLRLAFVGGYLTDEQVFGLRAAFLRYITAMEAAL